MRILFFGTPSFAETLLRGLLSSSHSIVGVVSQPDRPRGRGLKESPSEVKACALEHNIACFTPNRCSDPGFLQLIQDLGVDVFVVVAYGKILPESLLSIPKWGALNVHGSLLPFYRGAAPIERMILSGEKQVGFTLMQIDAGMDSGPVIQKVEIPYLEEESASEMRARMSLLAIGPLCALLDQIEKEGKIRVQEQDHSKATFAPKIGKEELWLDGGETSVEILSKIRAFDEAGGARMLLQLGAKKVLLKIFRARPSDHPLTQEVEMTPKGIYLKCRDGAIELLELQVEGSRRMDAASFLAGHARKH